MNIKAFVAVSLILCSFSRYDHTAIALFHIFSTFPRTATALSAGIIGVTGKSIPPFFVPHIKEFR